MTQYTMEDWIDHAIAREQYAHDYYTEAIGVVEGDESKSLLKRLADEELGHKTRLEKVKKSGSYQKLGRGLKNKQVNHAETRAFKQINKETSPAEILDIAILNENNAKLFYQWFIEVYAGTELEEFFTKLTEEEQRHAELLAEVGKKL